MSDVKKKYYVSNDGSEGRSTGDGIGEDGYII